MNPAYDAVRARIDAAAQRVGHPVRLLAVSKTQPAQAVRELAALGQQAFGENYVREALTKRRELAVLDLEWHLIGPLQSNKCREVAEHFDWLQSLDREKLIEPLNRYRAGRPAPLNVLIQVNIDAEASKSGCAPDQVGLLAASVAAAPHLRLRGLMAIPAPLADTAARNPSFTAMRELYAALKSTFPQVDTLSMGMSDDFEPAIAAGATMVRVGSALFGARR
ncbi:MAG: YggS family pyridoxal phosphate-dependent enzyme [Rudaea sp.]|nr:YggS family pyridoxal phosphate-dependent enzyme [Rudaea sp.]